MIRKKITLNLAVTTTLLLWLVFAQSTHAVTYSATLENSNWWVRQSPLECKLSQSIPRLGTAVFQHKAGEELNFHLETRQDHLKPGVASLEVEGPAWKVNIIPKLIADVEVAPGSVPLAVAYPDSGRMLEHLNRGMMLTFGLYSSADLEPAEMVKVAISTVNFNSAYQEYLDCMAQLLPVDFLQIARSAIYFNTSKTSLSEEVEAQLALIARYIIADVRIRRVVIDGHTDNRGNKSQNRELSKQRTDMVAGFFKKEGINSQLIVSRYHADKYPVLENDSEENRARNRRVTIRLERE